MDLLNYIKKAEKEKKAIGHFNISNLEQLHAITNVARRLNVPVIIGVSEGEREFIGVHEVAALIKVFREEGGIPIFLNADHTRTLEKIEEAARAGFDAAIIDVAKLPLSENIKITKKAVELAKSINPKMVIEGELGYIGTASEVRDSLPEGAAIEEKDLTTVHDAVKYVTETGINMLAPAVGNVHGMLARPKLTSGGGMEYDPPLNIVRIKAIKDAVKTPLVLHGASGNTDEDIRGAINAGISLIHISTEIRVAWREGIEESLKEKPNEVAPYKIMKTAIEEMEAVIEAKLKLFNNIR